MTTDRPELTLTEAATAAGVSRKTIRRRLDADEFPNAQRLDGPAGTATGPWVIPVTDLLVAGFALNAPDTPPEPAAPLPVDTDRVADLAATVENLRTELATERIRREAADALLESSNRNADDLRNALRMLEAGPQPIRRRHWWNRSAAT